MFQTIIREILSFRESLKKMDARLQQQSILTGRAISAFNSGRTETILGNLHASEFKVFSQWGDDGIIDFLTQYLDIPNRVFVEFGVENYTEANTRFLLMNQNWTGLVMDGSEKNIAYVKKDAIYWQYGLTARAAFVTAENVNDLITGSGISGEIGLLHIDVDGNDYWIWKAVHAVNPIIVVVEYNSIFGRNNKWTVPYDAGFVRGKRHHSNLYYGVSTAALCDLADEKGYSFVGCNSNGNNAYFVRNDKMGGLSRKTPQEGFVRSVFSESRDKAGRLTFLRGEDRLREIQGMPVCDLDTGQIVSITIESHQA
jgi:hypothetical protein